MTDEDVNDIEIKLKGKMLKLVSGKLANSYFVGKYFENDPESFEITRAVRKKLKAVSDYVREAISKDDKIRFTLRKKQKVDLDGTTFVPAFCGYYFTKNQQVSKTSSLDEVLNISISLYESAHKCLRKFATESDWIQINESFF